MKELEYLAKQAKYALIAPSPKQAISAKPETILAIAEAFGALEQEVKKNLEGALAWQQRAEAAEAKLEKQQPMAYRWESPVNGKICYDGIKPLGVISQPLYLRPAPAINLAELVEHETTLTAGVNALVDCLEDCGDAEQGLRLALRAILHKIEEEKK